MSMVGFLALGCGPTSEVATDDSAGDSASDSAGASEGGDGPVGPRQVWSVVGRCGGGKDVALLADGRIAVVGDGYVDDATTEQSVGYAQLYGPGGEELWDLSLIESQLSPNAVAIGGGDEIVAVGVAAQGAHATALDDSGNVIATVEPVLFDGGELELVDATLGTDGALLILGNGQNSEATEFAVWVGAWTLGDSIDDAATIASDGSHFEPVGRSITTTPQGIAVCGYEWLAEATAVWTAAYSEDYAPLWTENVTGSLASSYQECSAVRSWGAGVLSAGQIEPDGGQLYAYDADGTPSESVPALPSPQSGELVEIVDLATNDTLLAIGGRDKDYPYTGRRSWIRWHDDEHALLASAEASEVDPFVPDARPDIRAIAMDEDGAVVAVGSLETGGGHGCLTRLWIGKFVLAE